VAPVFGERLSLCRTNPARGSKLGRLFCRETSPGNRPYFSFIGVMRRNFLATFQQP
jgi:hypothetical protein